MVNVCNALKNLRPLIFLEWNLSSVLKKALGTQFNVSSFQNRALPLERIFRRDTLDLTT
jgi:hypothetical protein